MIDIISKKYWYFVISLLVIIPGTISLLLWGINFSIDFTGGSHITFATAHQQEAITLAKNVFSSEGVQIVTIQQGNGQFTIRTKPINEKVNKKIVDAVVKQDPTVKQIEFETIGPVIGKETTFNALKALLFATVLIVLYIAYSFRMVPKPMSSWRFGIAAIVALLHDVLVVLGIFSILGHFFGVEVDSLFVTAVLTVIGFSVHDTIVVFDRIRENLRRVTGVPFPTIVNDSILQTLVRSLNTSLTAMLVLFTLLIFGGETIHWFVVALLIGIFSGTYSSIFNAAPLLVVWQEYIEKRRNK